MTALRVASSGRREHRADVVHRQVEVAEPADQPGLADLLGPVVAIAAARVGPRGLEQPHVVVVAQRLHGQERHPREVADGQQLRHASSLHSPPGGESSGPVNGVDPPVAGGRRTVRMNTITNPETTFRRGPLAVLLTGIFLIVLDFFVVNVALPSVQQDLDADATALQWLVAGYALTFGGLLLVASRLADRWGRRRMFMLGTGLFVLSSAVCGFAPDVDTLLVARLVQGASAAMVAPTVLVPHRRRVRRAAAGPRARRLRHGHGRGRRLRPADRRAADPPRHRRLRLALDLPGQRADRHRRPRRRAAAAAGHPGRHPAPGRRRDASSWSAR